MSTAAPRALLVVVLSLGSALPAAADPPEPRARLEHDGAITCLAFSPDGKLLAAGDRDGSVRLWNVATGKQVHKLSVQRGEIPAVAFAPSGKTLATAGTDGIIRVWELATGKELARLETPYAGNGIAFTADGSKLIVAESSGNMSFLEPTTLKETSSFKLEGPLRWAIPLADGRTLAALTVKHNRVGEEIAIEATLRFLEIDTGKEIRSASFAADRVTMSGDGHSIVGRAGDGGITLREMAAGRERCRLPGSFTSVAFTAEGRFLFAADGKDHTIHIHDLVAGKEVVRMEEHEAPVTALAVSPDGRTLASGGGDFTVYLWDLAILDKKRPLPRLVLSEKELDARWQDLSESEEAARAFQARNAMVRAPGQAVPLLKQRLRTALLVDPQLLARYLADLDSGDFTARQKATTELERLGDLAEPALKQILDNKPSLEVRRRVEQLLTKLEKRPLSPVQLQVVRGVEVLEVLGTPEARKLLEELATQKPQTLLTQEAQAAIRRLPRK